MLNAYANNGYIKERDLRHVLKSELTEMSSENLDIFIESLGLAIRPSIIFPFTQYNVAEIMDHLNQIM